MALNFPITPVVGQVFTAEGASFVWNGALWVVLSAANFSFATSPEAIAGTRNDLAVSPLTTQAAIDARGYQAGFLSETPIDVTASRVIATDNQNLTGRPLLVAVSFSQPVTNGFIEFRLSAAPIGAVPPAGTLLSSESPPALNRQRHHLAVVPPNWFYRVTTTTTVVISSWIEYRGTPL